MPTDAEVRRERLRRELTYNTPFWAGGAVRDSSGAWHLPGPDDFPGVAKILDKRKQLVIARPYPWQLELDDALEKQRAEGRPMRAIILKARKLGFSTWVALKFLQRLTMLPYQQAVIVAQDVKTANLIFNMAKLAHAHLPTPEELDVGFSIRPDVVKQAFAANGRTFLQFGESGRRLRENGRTGDSVLQVDTAGSETSGRGDTPSMVHFSELAWYEGRQAIAKMTGLLNGLPYEPETIAVMESTANGLNHFYKRWIAARDGAEDPETGETYTPIFVAWWRDPRAAWTFSSDSDRQRFIETIGNTSDYGEVAEDEPMLQELYGCTPEQLMWRRTMIRTQHNGSIELFNQENPHSDEAAFIGSGRTVFGGILVARAIKAAAEAQEPVTGTLEGVDVKQQKTRTGTVEVPQAAIWVPGPVLSGLPELRVWEHPVKEKGEWPEDVAEEDRIDGAYVVAVDVALGEANTFTKGDYHAVQVFDHRSHQQVAVHESRMAIELLPLWVLTIATYYNGAWVVPEINGPGIVLVESLVKTYRWPRIYHRRRYDRTADRTEDRPGWQTDQVTKHVLEGTFGEALQQETHGLRDPRTARQLSTYVVTEKNKHEAQEGEHDDLLMAAMIAQEFMREYRPPKPRKKGAGLPRRRRPRDPVTGY